MKLGSETGSLINHLTTESKQPAPEVGMGATQCRWSDRHAGTIVEVGDGYLVFQRDDAKRIDSNGMSESQTYEFTPNPNAHREYYRLDREGRWRASRLDQETNRWKFTEKSQSLRIGVRDEYYDFTF